MAEHDMDQWLIASLIEEDMSEYTIKVTGSPEKGENYMGEVLFVEVSGKLRTGECTSLHLVVKSGKKNKLLRKQMNLRRFYLREINFYENIIPAFNKFQLQKGVSKIFTSIPKCYKTIKLEEMEVIVMENLKKKGYSLYDKYKSMDLHHIRSVLDTYARFHAISFALRDQKEEEFEKITKKYHHLFEMFEENNPKDYYKERLNKLMRLLKYDHPTLVCNLEKTFGKGMEIVTLDIIKDRVKESVVTHGDCWNNNFMFKYVDQLRKIPKAVALLDWQVSSLHSPVLDLSYFLYLVSSREEVSKFDELLRYYHSNLSHYIRELGSSPDELFPLSTLAQHWAKYSAFGVIQAITSMEMVLCDNEAAVSFDDVGGQENMVDAWVNKVRPKNMELYKERMVAVLESFFEGNLKLI